LAYYYRIFGHFSGIISVELTNTKTEFYEKNVLTASEIFVEYGNFIRTVIRYHVNNEHQVDDLFQDFFLSLVYRPIPDRVDNIKSYIYRAVTNDIIDSIRRVEKYQKHTCKYRSQSKKSINKNSPADALIGEEQLDKLLELIKGRLTASESKAITLRYGENHSVSDIAEKMGVKSRSVSRYISVGLKKIRQFLAGK